ncbi:hypothetical protein BAZSYMA_ACONTIG15578_2 [Bathymodiolus azoricus thioautotrophic gill symbiont]|uniref:Uncharacterized protein n=1 Tax=Bathymodiolus azoricus thioautotrophic gill symbiont TaxID=235205 RepID=A0A1H6KVS9_9GAMM|nr:hypothetical protein BAZSYMA_ACONTIG15578_2 [Bathymodiolus azoricus thioautotrophic gill symbiont]
MVGLSCLFSYNRHFPFLWIILGLTIMLKLLLVSSSRVFSVCSIHEL